MHLFALQLDGDYIKTQGGVQVKVHMRLSRQHLFGVHKTQALGDEIVHAVLLDVLIAVGVAAQEAHQPALAALKVPGQTQLSALATVHEIGQQMAQHFAGRPLGILHAHPAPDGMGHVVGQRHDVRSLASALQHTDKPLQLLVVESVIILAQSLRSFTVQKDDANLLLRNVVIAVCLALDNMQVAA